MTVEAWITVAIAAGTIVALARTRVSTGAIGAAGMILLMVTGVLAPAEALAGFANPAPFTVAALYVIAAAASKTGLLAPLTERMLPKDGGSLARVAIPSAGVSAFFNNTPLVAMLIPDVLTWARRTGNSASRLLLPISYAAILGGMTTLVGTSTNLLVSGLVEESGDEPLGMFEFARVGLPAAVVGLGVLLLVSARLTPKRVGAAASAVADQRSFTVGMQVEPDGPLVGTTVRDAGLRDLEGVYLVEIVRAGVSFAPVAPDRVLQAGDDLTFVGGADEVIDLQRKPGLTSLEQEHLLAVEGPGHTFFEAVVARSSSLAGKTLREADFRAAYGAAVVAIHRDGARVEGKLGQVVLQFGDTLLLLANPSFAERRRHDPAFLLVARVGGPPPSAGRNAAIVGVGSVAMVALAVTGIVPILTGSLVVVGLLVLLRVLTVSEAREAVDLDVVITIGAALALGRALVETGVAQAVADGLVRVLGGVGTIGVVSGIVVATVVLTEIVTNNAAAVIMVPIAAATADVVGLAPRELAIGVAVAASASFLGPLGYQTNTMVYGPGGYRLGDYVRAGLPLTLAVAVTTTVVLAL